MRGIFGKSGKKKVIVKRLNSIQNFGAMDVLCTDKTGTLTQGKIVLEKHLDVDGNERDEILNFAYLNSFYQTGLKNVMDIAVLDHKHLEKQLIGEQNYRKIDEIPFDFVRRRMSVVVEDNQKRHILICKGAVEEIITLSTQIEIEGKILPIDDVAHHMRTETLVRGLNEEGFRVVALAYKIMPETAESYTVADESDLILFRRQFLLNYLQRIKNVSFTHYRSRVMLLVLWETALTMLLL